MTWDTTPTLGTTNQRVNLRSKSILILKIIFGFGTVVVNKKDDLAYFFSFVLTKLVTILDCHMIMMKSMEALEILVIVVTCMMVAAQRVIGVIASLVTIL